ncbi:MAG TPA: hypothetical protein GXZ30_15835, partial [Propionibacterium sp.]|nr:hypothetical protein [Propionibacterium sp.]
GSSAPLRGAVEGGTGGQRTPPARRHILEGIPDADELDRPDEGASHCVIGGRADSDIVAWHLDLDSAMAVSPVVVAGGVPDDTNVVAAAANGDWIALTDGTNTRVARVRRDGWDNVRITGRLGAMATDSTGRAVLATTGPDGITRLWTSRR